MAPQEGDPHGVLAPQPAGAPRRRMPPLTLYPALLMGLFHLSWPPVLSLAVLSRVLREGLDPLPGAELWLGLATLAAAPVLVLGTARGRGWAWPALLVFLGLWGGIYVAAAHWMDGRALLPAALMLAAALLAALPASRGWFEARPEPVPAEPVALPPPGKPRLTVLAGGREAGGRGSGGRSNGAP